MVLIRLFCAALSMELYSLLPYSEVLYRFFPLQDQELSLQAYVDYAGTRLGFIILFYEISLHIPVLRKELFLTWLLLVGYLIDYFINYNLAIKGTFLSYTSFMMLCFGLILVKTYMKVKNQLT